MNRYCSRLYRKVCLEINSGLTTKEKEELLFYCRDVLPVAVTKNSSILTTLSELQRRRVLLFEDKSFLRQFLEDIERLDLLTKVEAFDVSGELVWLFESVMSSKIRRKFCHGPFDVGNGDDGNRLLSDFVKHQDVSDRISRLTVAARRQLKEKGQEGSGIANITSILVDFRWKIIEHSDSKRMTWQLIPPLIKFASELAISGGGGKCPRRFQLSRIPLIFKQYLPNVATFTKIYWGTRFWKNFASRVSYVAMATTFSTPCLLKF